MGDSKVDVGVVDAMGDSKVDVGGWCDAMGDVKVDDGSGGMGDSKVDVGSEVMPWVTSRSILGVV